MSFLTIANMKKGVLLHKLILLEVRIVPNHTRLVYATTRLTMMTQLVLGYWQSFYIFFPDPAYGWVLSVGAIPLNISWSIHNVVAWMKLRPFLSKWQSRIFIGTIILVQPYWVVEIFANFAYFHGMNDMFLKTRPFEALFRDPWWVIACILLIHNIRKRYEMRYSHVLMASAKFTVMLAAMFISIVFIVVDILSVTDAFKNFAAVGLNPWWKLAMIFKCLTDSVILDDFKTTLDRLWEFQIARLTSCEVADSHELQVRPTTSHISGGNDASVRSQSFSKHGPETSVRSQSFSKHGN
ncbi:uncharacterized protein PG998_005429 [Apiospora kogelbergensis]|uniref:Uncharacterized protein n=1 Tax=Apiospora kogelbergensis TaxID=1337665 RepID=A0AAW0QGS2_9PEZI